MPRRLLIVSFFPLLLCQCKTTRTVAEPGMSGANIGEGEGALLQKFAGNFKPEDASWYTASGEDGQKKKGKERQEAKRSSFEQTIAKTRDDKSSNKTSRWDQRSVYDKQYSGNTTKKAFSWPWSKKYDIGSKYPDTNYQKSLPTPSESQQRSRDENFMARDADRNFDTTDFHNSKPGIKHSEYWPAAKPSAHRPVPMMDGEGAAAKDKDSGWSLSDVRKLLNKG